MYFKQPSVCRPLFLELNITVQLVELQIVTLPAMYTVYNML